MIARGILYKCILFGVLTVITSSIFGQKMAYNLLQLLNTKKLVTYNRAVSPLTNGVKIDENEGEGISWLAGVKFSSGTIEIDLRGQDVFQKSFIGIAFHGVNDSTYDAIYFRPFNFHAKDSVRKIHAVQYISHPVYTWRKLREERNGIFEKALVSPPDAIDWFHARIEVSGGKVQVFVNDDKEPSLTITKLNIRNTGSIGLWVGDGSGGEFANLEIKKRD